MPSFTIRVELHHADDDDYETLHSEMEDRGFRRTIVSDDNTTYHLPTAEYNYSGNVDLDAVLTKAKSAARATGKSAAVLVTQSGGRKWHGLAEV